MGVLKPQSPTEPERPLCNNAANRPPPTAFRSRLQPSGDVAMLGPLDRGFGATLGGILGTDPTPSKYGATPADIDTDTAQRVLENKFVSFKRKKLF